MRLHLLILSILLGHAALFARIDYLSCDFSDGIPAGFALFDRDGNRPSTEMEALGYAQGTPGSRCPKTTPIWWPPALPGIALPALPTTGW